MEPSSSLPHSQTPVTCPYPEPDQSSPSHFLKILSDIIFHLRLGLPSDLFRNVEIQVEIHLRL